MSELSVCVSFPHPFLGTNNCFTFYPNFHFIGPFYLITHPAIIWLNPIKWLYSVIKRCCCFCFHHRLNPAELTFLTEYAAAMSPVAQATNILQVEANAQMGWLLPTINLLTTKLDRVKLPLKYCKPLVDALQVTFILLFYTSYSILAYYYFLLS